MMPEPISIATTILSGVGSTAATTLKLANFFKDIKNTPTDIKTCFDLTNRVRLDLQHLISLRGKHVKYLATVPDIATHVDSIIHSTSESVEDASKLLEACRKEIYEENIIPYNRKVQWVLGDSAAFARRTSNLQQQHVATILEITHLRQVDMLKPLEIIATTTFENLELLTIKKKKIDSRINKDNLLAENVPVAPAALLAIPSQMSPVGLPQHETIYCNTSDFPASMQSNLRHVPIGTGFTVDKNENTEVDETNEDDPEIAFYKDLRRQEDERQRRLAARQRHQS